MKRGIWVLGLLITAPAAADEPPRLDTRPACLARTSDATDFAECQRSEESYRLRLSTRWRALPDFRKHFCEQSVAFQKPSKQSYSALAACLGDPASS